MPTPIDTALCRTKYPLLLLHGLNCRDHTPLPYWGRIPKALTQHGAVVYSCGQDAWGTIRHNSLQIRQAMLAILARNPWGKFNIIAHSKGGLEARCLVSTLDMAPRVASITTVSTPHHGSQTARWLLAQPLPWRSADALFNGFWRLLGDQRPAMLTVLQQLTPEYLRQFNQDNPDQPGIFYQSYGVALQDSLVDPAMALSRRLVYRHDGENDGLVALSSARWGLYRGTIAPMSHQDIVDCRRLNCTALDPRLLYLAIASDLKKRGL